MTTGQLKSAITLIPNNFETAAVTYTLTSVTAREIVDDYLERLDPGYSLLLKFERVGSTTDTP